MDASKDGTCAGATELEKLDTYLDYDQDDEITIKVGDDEIRVRKSVIIERSDYFKAMFTHNTLEKQSGIVEMKEVEFKPVKACIDSMLGKEIDISFKNCEELFNVASIIQLSSLLEKICQFLQNILDYKTFFKVKKIAEHFFLEDLKEFCHDFALDHLDIIVKIPEFGNLEAEFVSSLIVLKKSVHPRREDSKLAIILRWVNVDPQNRHKHLQVLLNHINLMEISDDYLEYVLENEKVCTDSEECMKMFESAEANKSDLEKNSSVKPKQAEICFQPEPNAILVSDQNSSSLKAYHPSSHSWSLVCPFPPKCKICGDVVVTKDYVYLYVVSENKKMYKIDISQDHPLWLEMEDMQTDHWAPRAALHDGHIYVVGDHSAERYNIRKGQWSWIDGNDNNMDNSAVVACDGFLYSIGGTSGSKEVQKLCTKTLAWSEIEPMNLARSRPHAVVDNQNIYVVGGTSDNGGGVELYSCETGSWTHLTSYFQKLGVWQFGLSFFNEMLYSLNIYAIERYDPKTQYWTRRSHEHGLNFLGCSSAPLYYAPPAQQKIMKQHILLYKKFKLAFSRKSKKN